VTRLFTFGCSFTNYHWSTWADLLGEEFDEFQNWGKSGAGNHYIFNSVMEADQRWGFGSGDTVVICWSSTFREDRHVGPPLGWVSLGNIFYSDRVSRHFIDHYMDLRGCLIRDLAMIKATKHFLAGRPGVTWRFLSMCQLKLEERTWLFNDQDQDALDLYQDVTDSIAPSYFEVLGRFAPKSVPFLNDPDRAHGPDNHPTPLEHLAYLDAVLPGWITKEITRQRAKEETENLVRWKEAGSVADRL
jgi:hypothetical protein